MLEAMRTQAQFIASLHSSDINASHFHYYRRFFIGNACGRSEGGLKYSPFVSPPSYQSWAEMNYHSSLSCKRIRATFLEITGGHFGKPIEYR
jgi:hypothetical protein